MIPNDYVETIEAMGPALTLYLVELTLHHELLISEDLTNFLDEEIASMIVPVVPPLLTTFDLVLINQSTHAAVVYHTEEHSFKVPARHLIVWKFDTVSFDIGFTLEMNGKVKIPLTRYRSHEMTIFGALHVESFSDCVLRWDNSYARCKLYPEYCTLLALTRLPLVCVL
jgi:hypothetical protein